MAHDWGQGSECEQSQGSVCDQCQESECEQGQGSVWDQAQGSECLPLVAYYGKSDQLFPFLDPEFRGKGSREERSGINVDSFAPGPNLYNLMMESSKEAFQIIW